MDKEIVTQLANGLSQRQIAYHYGKSHRTIEGKVEKLKLDHGAQTVTHLVAIFIRKGWIK